MLDLILAEFEKLIHVHIKGEQHLDCYNINQ